MEKRLFTMFPVIKLVGNACNLRCRYCFYHDSDQEKKHIISPELLEKFIKEYFLIFKGNVKFTWHGGEPLLAGREIFNRILQLQQKYKSNKHNISNSIQTNGTLINKDWAIFFKENNFRVGVSLDGNKISNDTFRKMANGSGSFDKIVNGINLLKEYNVPIGVLQTISNANIKNPVENLSFIYNDLGIKDIGFCVLSSFENPNTLENTLQPCACSPTELTNYILKAYHFWKEQNDMTFKIRELDNYLSGIFYKKATVCTFNGTCAAFFCLDSNGDIYPCDTLSSNKNYCFGNLLTKSLDNILLNNNRKFFLSRLNDNPESCAKCSWFYGCSNGCPSQRDTNNLFKYCKTRKEVFEQIEADVIPEA